MGVLHFASGAVSGGEVTALAHEVGDQVVERRSFEVEGLAAAIDSLLTGAEGAKVLGGPRGGVDEKLKHDAVAG